MVAQPADRRTPAVAAVAVVLAAVLAAAWLFGAPRPLPPSAPPIGAELLRTWLKPLPQPALIENTARGLAIAKSAAPQCRAELVPLAQASATAQRFGSQALERPPSADLECLAWLDAAAARLACADPKLPVVRPGDAVQPLTALDRLLLVLSALLVGALPVLLLLGWWRMDRRQRQMAALVFSVALLARLLWPWRLTAVYFAYEWFAQAAYLDSVPRYGPGSTALWGMVLGPQSDHRAVLALQVAVGALNCAIWALAAARVAGRAQTGLWVGLALALTPVVLRDHASESMHVPALLGVAAAAWAAAELSQRPSRLFGALLVAGCAFAALCRFEVGPMALAVAAAFAWMAAPQQPWRQQRWAWLGAAAAIAVTLGRAVSWAERDLDRGNLPQLALWAQWLPQRLAADVLLWRGDWLPLGLWAPVVLWLAVGRAVAPAAALPAAAAPAPRHHRWLILLPLAVLAVLPSWLDYNETSLPRLQQPAAHLAIVCGGALLAQLAGQDGSRWRWRTWAVAVLWAASALPTWAHCLRPTNAHTEDQLLRRAAADLAQRQPADQPAWLAVRSYADGDTAGLHLHQPTYAFGGVRLTSVTAAEQVLQQCQNLATPLYFLRSTRCSAAPRGRPHPGELGACAALSRWPGRQVVWQEEVNNSGDSPTFAWYGSAAELPVGLYQLTW